MRMVDLIEKKRDNNELNYDELKFIIDSYVKGDIPEYQMSAFLMAVYFSGMTVEETTNMAIIMRDSGDVLDLSRVDGIKVDKHSTGGVGDKTSLIIGPIVASCGAKFAKMSGRGLAHTGGTIDKLESIPGYKVNISEDDFIKQVNDIGIVLVGQSGCLAPADKKIYALRDVTATVASMPLIASSIMSKKLASGADAICLDVKVGTGAFMKNKDDALCLAKLMVEIGKKCNKKMTAILTNMDEPLGYAVGNNLEVIEAINTLNGSGSKDLLEICILISGYLLYDAKIVNSIEEGTLRAKKAIDDKSALNKLVSLVASQGGDASYIYDVSKFPKSKYKRVLKSSSEGYIVSLDAHKIGYCAMLLGAGRKEIDDSIDQTVGIVLNKKIADYVKENDVLAYIYSNDENDDDIVKMVENAFVIGETKNENNLIIDIVR